MQLHPSQLGIPYGTLNEEEVAFPCPQAACDKYIYEACISETHLGDSSKHRSTGHENSLHEPFGKHPTNTPAPGKKFLVC